MGVEMIGGNCGSGPEEIEAVMVTMTAERPDGVLLLAQSNAGLPQLVGDEFHYGGTPGVMAGYATRMAAVCAGVLPQHDPITSTPSSCMRSA